MDSDRGIHINWLRFNVPSLFSIVGAAVAVVVYVNTLDNRVAKMEDYRTTRTMIVDNRFNDIQTSLQPLVNLPYRVNVLEQQNIATNARIDRFSEAISTTMELIRKDVNGLSTKVEVLGTKIDNITPEKRAEISTPTAQ